MSLETPQQVSLSRMTNWNNSRNTMNRHLWWWLAQRDSGSKAGLPFGFLPDAVGVMLQTDDVPDLIKQLSGFWSWWIIHECLPQKNWCLLFLRLICICLVLNNQALLQRINIPDN